MSDEETEFKIENGLHVLFHVPPRDKEILHKYYPSRIQHFDEKFSYTCGLV